MAFTDIALMRLYLGDPDLLNNGVGITFTDQQLTDLLALHSDDMDRACADGWRIKAATVADWYQATADGTSLSRQQVFDHCMRMSNVYDKLADEDDSLAGVSMVSVRLEVDEETGTELTESEMA